MDELERQAAEERVALEAETARAVWASHEARELRKALADIERQVAAREVAAAGVRAEVVGLRRQLETASKVKG